MATKRKARKKTKGVDILKPISQVTIDQLGSAEDPCFGKHFDPREDECSRCGDSELCAIKMMQQNTIKRAKAEAEGKFKDMEEKNDPLRADPLQVKKMVRRRIKELLKLKMKDTDIAADLHATYNGQGYSIKRIIKIINLIKER